MQCQSYFPSYNSQYDLNMDNNGGVKLVCNGNGIFRSAHYNNHMSPLPVAEFLRQTIVMQEVTFRDQVQELHRLYRRQKELMGETRSKELYRNHLHLGGQCSYSFSVKLGQNTNFSGNGGTSNNMLVQETKGKKFGRKFLDLELPAEEYIDIEEGESFEDAQYPNTPSFPCPSNVPSKAVVETHPMAWLDPILQKDSPKTNLADLNEPLIASDLEGRILEETGSLLEVSCFNNRSVDASLGSLKGCCLESELTEAVVSVPSIASDPLKHATGLNRLDLNSAVDENLEVTPSDTLSSKALNEVDVDRKQVMPLSREDVVSPRKSKRSRLIDINLPCETTEEDQPVIEHDVGHEHKNPGQINLNLSINDGGLPSKSSLLHKTSLEIDLEAPPSPEVEECPPPRGDSEETQPEDGGDPLEELLKIAAEAIVSISSSSSSKSQPSPEKFENVDTDTLEWFAGLVHSISSDLETHALDEFEAMTLNLTEMSADEYWSQNTVKIENFSYSTPLSGQMRKGRTIRRAKRKDFQKEVLPSLASLSRYEVTEDIQMIEGLMEAVGTPWHLSRARRASRKGRKSQGSKPECSAFETSISDSKSGALVEWGMANRRPRGQRSPASPSTVLSKWLGFVI